MKKGKGESGKGEKQCFFQNALDKYNYVGIYLSHMADRPLPDGALDLVATRFKIMSEPLRLRLLQLLQNGEKSVGELTELCSTSQPNVSKHLKILQTGGLVKRQQKGNTVYYSIADQSIFTLCELVCSSIEERLRTQAQAFSTI